MKRILFVIVSILLWIYFIISSFVLLPLAVLARSAGFIFDKKLKGIHYFTCFWGVMLAFVNPLWRVKVKGKGRRRRGQAYVVICNHQSLADIMVLYKLFFHFRWVAKIELFSTPILGWVMQMNNYVKIRRGSRQSAEIMINECVRLLKSNISVMIFPEGTRSPDGRLQHFKEGAFRIAKMANCPILPVVIHGTANAIPKGSIFLKEQSLITLEVLDPIPADVIQAEEIKDTIVRTRKMYEEYVSRTN